MTERGERIIGKLEQDPSTLMPDEQFIVGLAHIQTAVDDEIDPAVFSEDETSREQLLRAGVQLTSNAMKQIRTDDRYSERQRLALAGQALGEQKAVIENLDTEGRFQDADTRNYVIQTFLLLSKGLDTPIKERIHELHGQIVQGYKDLTAHFMLANAASTLDESPIPLSPAEQIAFLDKRDDEENSEQNRRVALAWAKNLMTSDEQEPDDIEGSSKIPTEDVIEIFEYFSKKSDRDALEDLTSSIGHGLFGPIYLHFSASENPETRQNAKTILLAKLETDLQNAGLIE